MININHFFPSYFRMYIGWIFLLLICGHATEQYGSESINNDEDFQTEISTNKIGRMRYIDGEVMIFQNQQKPTEFFFTPFPYLQSEETQCHENALDDRIELGVQVELYTPQLIQAAKDYIHRYQSVLCGNISSSSMCDVSLLPINSIRLIQRNSRLNNTQQKYTLDDSWQLGTLVLQTMEFLIYTSNMTVCEQLHKTLTDRCRTSNFEVHYSTHGQRTVQRQLEVTTEHLSTTHIYNQIRTRFPVVDTVLLAENHFKELLSQSTDRSIMTLRSQEGFDSLQDPTVIHQLLEQQLSDQQVCDNNSQQSISHSFILLGATRND